jgi:hypothetical protein
VFNSKLTLVASGNNYSSAGGVYTIITSDGVTVASSTFTTSDIPTDAVRVQVIGSKLYVLRLTAAAYTYLDVLEGTTLTRGTTPLGLNYPSAYSISLTTDGIDPIAVYSAFNAPVLAAEKLTQTTRTQLDAYRVRLGTIYTSSCVYNGDIYIAATYTNTHTVAGAPLSKCAILKIHPTTKKFVDVASFPVMAGDMTAICATDSGLGVFAVSMDDSAGLPQDSEVAFITVQ